NADFGWILEERAAATYETTGVGVRIHDHTDPAPTINRAGGVQTVVVTPTHRPDMRFIITLDADALPAAGNSIDSNSNDARPGWSWIVDPVCYVYPSPRIGKAESNIATLAAQNSLTINRGQHFPLRSAT